MSGQAIEFGDYSTFGEAAEGVMEMLSELHGIDAWFVTRIRLDAWIVTHLRGQPPFSRGDVAPLSQQAREQILGTTGPVTVTERELEALAEARDLLGAGPANAYVGAPLVVNDDFYGALCGVHSGHADLRAVEDSPALAMAARLLSTILRTELEAEELQRRAERAEAEALIDELTGLFNRRGWERLTAREEDRAGRYGHAATVFAMDVDGLKRINDRHGHASGDALLRAVADGIKSVVRDHDVAARVGGDEFAVLAVETDLDAARAVYERLEAAFSAAGAAVSIGMASMTYSGGIAEATIGADAEMYRRKAAHG